jgi:hypothetical protein
VTETVITGAIQQILLEGGVLIAMAGIVYLLGARSRSARRSRGRVRGGEVGPHVLERRAVLDVEPQDVGVPHRHLHRTQRLAALVGCPPASGYRGQSMRSARSAGPSSTRALCSTGRYCRSR